VKTSISQITTVTESFADDLDAYRAAGADGIGIWEMKLADDSLVRFRGSGLEAAAAIPLVPSILPLPLMEGPAEPAERVEALCASVERLARFGPACVLLLTGPGDRATVVEGIRQVADAAARAGVPLALEPIQREFRDLWSIVSTLGEAAALLDEAGRPDVGVVLDTWHLWNSPELLDEIERHRDRILALHVADWRDPTRNTNDRVLPGDGVVDFAAIFEVLAWDGLYDLEIFSDPELEGSLWLSDPRELAKRGVEALRSVSA
jgi:sugar phosphate isomerase/epimerase